MNKERYQKYIQQERLKYIDKSCEWCGKDHDHTYGTGRFCSKSCQMSYNASQNKFSEKHKSHLKKLHDKNKVPYGTWKCEECDLIFETKKQLQNHKRNIHSFWSQRKTKDGKYQCQYCGKVFDKHLSLMAHCRSCKKHPNKELHDLAYKKQGETFSEKCKNGEIDVSKLSHPHSLETKQHLSEVRAAKVKNEYLTNFHAKVKWYKVKNIEGQEFSVRGMWEVNVSKRLNELHIYWIKANPLKYFKNYWHNYTADFYIPSLDVYVEVKGRYSDFDREKMRLVCRYNPDKKIYFIHDVYQDFINGKLNFDDTLVIQQKDL